MILSMLRRGTGRSGKGNSALRGGGRSHPPTNREANASLSAWWAVVPFISAGLFAWAPFLYATLRTGYRRFRTYTVVYACLAVIELTLIAPIRGSVGGLAVAFSAIPFIAAVHTLAIREEFRRRVEVRRHPALLTAQRQADLRAEGRRLVAREPTKARAIGVGRPDLPDSFDAGLIDVNHAPAWVLIGLPGIDPEVVDRIIDLRSAGSGFRSLEDLDLALDLPADQLQALRDRGVFIPDD